MQQTSPLGQFAPVVAALAAAAILVAFIMAALLGLQGAETTLHDPFVLAVGVIFGSAAAVPAINGHVAAQATAANRRLDALGAPPAEAVDGKPAVGA